MKRIVSKPRPGWQQILKDTGHNHGQWDESAHYQLTPMEAKEIQIATSELQTLSLRAVDYVIAHKLYDDLGIPAAWAPIIERSWKRRDHGVIGRMDLAYDGINPPKLLEYDADDFHLLIETAWHQREWLVATFPDAPVEQFADLVELLPKRWEEIAMGLHVHFSCILDDQEALDNTIFMREMANMGHCTTTDIDVKMIGWMPSTKKFVGEKNEEIERLAKFYPWDWLLKERFAANLGSDPMEVIEPAWKVLLSSKGILKVLWKMNQGHPNLLPAAENYIPVGQQYVKKPLFGRGGQNVTIHERSGDEKTSGHLESDKFVYQGIAALPNFDGRFPVVSSFLVGDKPAGIGIREDGDRITSSSAVFVPHAVYAENSK